MSYIFEERIHVGLEVHLAKQRIPEQFRPLAGSMAGIVTPILKWIEGVEVDGERTWIVSHSGYVLRKEKLFVSEKEVCFEELEEMHKN